MTLPDDAQERKNVPIASGVLDYFPDALAEVARVSKIGNDQHNPGQPLHWAKEKSTDEADALVRHLLERGTRDSDGTRHTAKVAWRALALLQRELDAEKLPAYLDGRVAIDVSEFGEEKWTQVVYGDQVAREFSGPLDSRGWQHPETDLYDQDEDPAAIEDLGELVPPGYLEELKDRRITEDRRKPEADCG